MINSNVPHQIIMILYNIYAHFYTTIKKINPRGLNGPKVGGGGSKMQRPERASVLRDTYISYSLYFISHLSHDFPIAERDGQNQTDCAVISEAVPLDRSPHLPAAVILLRSHFLLSPSSLLAILLI